MSSPTQFLDWQACGSVGRSDIDALAAQAASHPSGRARICLHRGHGDAVHEMVIAVRPSGFVLPHRQAGVDKSYLVLRGEFGLVFFDDDGVVTDAVRLTPGDRPIARFDAGLWHVGLASSAGALYVETIPGPFHPERTEWADWAPREDAPGLEPWLAKARAELQRRCGRS
ncbi:MAG: WbuC family cupin fold metalloprotein [Planctomycetota bacterium]